MMPQLRGFMPGAPATITLRLARRSFTISFRNVLWIIVAMAVLLRLVSAVYQGNTVTDLPGVYDQISYDGLARRVADGFGFSFAEGHWPATRAGEPTAHWSFLYTLYLATIYNLIGPYPLLARLIQAVIAGLFQTLFLLRIGTRLFNPTVGLIAAALNAIYIYFFYYAGSLVTETFYITSILWTFDSAFRLVDAAQRKGEDGQTPTRWQWLELGLAMGVAVLLRQVFLVFLPFLSLWLWWNIRGGEAGHWTQIMHWSAVKGLSVAILVLGLMILPFTIRNHQEFGTFVLLNTNAGFAFYWGNHPIHGTQFVPILPDSGPSYQDLIPPRLLDLNEGKLDKALLQEGIRNVLDNPVRYFFLSISRIKEYFTFWPSSDSGLLSNISRVGSFGVCLPFILYGLWMVLIRTWKSHTVNQKQAITLLLIFVLVYTSIHLLSWTLIRYRLPIDAVLLFFAAKGLNSLFVKNLALSKD